MTDKELASWVGVWQQRTGEATDAAKDEIGSFVNFMGREGARAGNAFAVGLASAIYAIKAAAKQATTAAQIGP
jgi:hypothetical protein